MKKYIFGIDITDDKNNDKIDGRVFETSEITAEQEKELEAVEKEGQELDKKAKLLLVFRILEHTAGCIALLFMMAGVICFDMYFAEVYHYAPFVSCTILICFAIWLVLLVFRFIHAKKDYSSDEAADLENNVNRLKQKLFKQFDIPENTTEIDVYVFQYKLKKDKAKFIKVGSINFINNDITAFTQNDCLCLADITMRMDIPLDSITEIKRIDKRVSFMYWNKEESHKKEPYKQYRISSNDYGYSVKYYYALCIQHFGTDYELLFPPYELPVIEKLTGKHYHD